MPFLARDTPVYFATISFAAVFTRHWSLSVVRDGLVLRPKAEEAPSESERVKVS